jgi:hypothetical protein
MKISPAIQLLMLAAAKAAALKHLNPNLPFGLNHAASGGGIRKKSRIKIKTEAVN